MPRVDGLTHQALGRIAGHDDLIPRVLPNEEIAVTPEGVRILTPSPHRVTAPCRHYKTCGGCALQHASDPFVADWKQSVVERALTARGLSAPLRSIVTSPAKSRRRAKFSGKRTKKGAIIGFHAKGSDQVTDITDCQLLLPELMAARPGLEALTLLACSRKGEIALTVTASDGGVDVWIETEKPLAPDLRGPLADIANTHGLARLTWNDEPVTERVPPRQQFDNIAVVPPPGAFLQATAAGEGALREAVREILQSKTRIVDLFAGCGTFALPLSRGAEVHAVEGNSDLLVALDHGWRSGRHLRRVTTETRDLFRRPLLADELSRFDGAVIDPPRAGAAAQVAEVAQSDLKTVAMVSCNPVTFARDAQALTDAGFAMNWVQVVDQFRWSAHVELVASFTRK